MPEQNLSISAVASHLDEEAEIATLAYRYYEEEGYPEARAHEHWLRAEQEVRGRTGSAAPKTTQAEPIPTDARTEEIMHLDQ
jgi:hypothetical protein